MKHILTIGYERFALPASANVNAILKALASAKKVKPRFHSGHEYFEEEGSAEISVRLVDDSFVVDPKKRARIPEKTGGPY